MQRLRHPRPVRDRARDQSVAVPVVVVVVVISIVVVVPVSAVMAAPAVIVVATINAALPASIPNRRTDCFARVIAMTIPVAVAAGMAPVLPGPGRGACGLVVRTATEAAAGINIGN